ncbi:MAG TPA: alpha/beta hydrolase [Solirubrobacteraceae bacterium]|nr:alpha/beta hydrolase [Solirubrobacteraceae bacterium]
MRLHHEIRGDGPPVLLVHAGIADSRMWEPLAERLVAAGRRVVAPDLRGFGRSPLPPETFSPAADLLELLDDLGIERAPVVGASFGGRVTLELALRAPGRVSAIALLDSVLDEFDPSVELEAFDEAETAAAEAGDLDEATAINVRMWLDRPGRTGVDPQARDLVAAMTRRAFEAQDGVDAAFEELDPPVARRLGEIRCPALVVVGEDDVEDFHRLAARLADELPEAGPVVVIPGAAHLPALERPAEVADVLLPFLRHHAAG